MNFLVSISNVLLCDVEVREVFGMNVQHVLLTTSHTLLLEAKIIRRAGGGVLHIECLEVLE